jgi:hypothetical protein
VSDATVDLVFRARNLADGAIKDLAGSVSKIGDAGVNASKRFAGAFAGMGDKVANSVGMVTETLASGGSLAQGLAQAGVFMAGQLAESFGGQLIEKLAGSTLIETLVAPLAALGTTIGGAISAAIPIGMALLPVILIGALVAAVAVLIVNPEIRGKVFAFAQGLIGHLLDAIRTALGALGALVSGVFGKAWQLVVDGVRFYIDHVVGFWLALPGRLVGLGASIVGTIVGGLTSLPGRIADVIGNAFRSLHIDVGPFHISGGGVTIDLPSIDVPHFASGVTGFSGGLAVVGERGPELVRLPRGADVIPNGRSVPGGGGDGGGVRIAGVTEREILDMVDRGLYFRLRRAGTGAT